MPKDPKRLEVLPIQVKALRNAIRINNFKRAQHLRMGLAGSLRHLEPPLQDDIARLFEISGLWLRNVGDRHDTKRQIRGVIRRIISRLSVSKSHKRGPR